MPYNKILQTNESWFVQIQRICGVKHPKEYVSKPLTEGEIKKVYHNDFFHIDSNAYFTDHEDSITKERRMLRLEGVI